MSGLIEKFLLIYSIPSYVLDYQVKLKYRFPGYYTISSRYFNYYLNCYEYFKISYFEINLKPTVIYIVASRFEPF